MAYERSSFPEKYDKFQEKFDVTPEKRVLVDEYYTLWGKTTRTAEEDARLGVLTKMLEPYLYTPEHINHYQDAMTNVQKFFVENTQGYVDRLQLETKTHADAIKADTLADSLAKKNETKAYMDSTKAETKLFVDGKTTYLVEFVNGQVVSIEKKATDSIQDMENKRKYFTTFVNTQVDEVRSIVQEFDSNSARYYTTWVSTTGQIDYNINQGSNLSLPAEANLNIATENIDLIINGVLQTPYKDFVIHNNGFYDTIRLTGNAQSLIQNGTEIVAKWYKNVGKLYFKHAHSHGEGGSDPLKITKGMLDTSVTDEFNNIPKKTAIAPNPINSRLWLDSLI